MRVGALRSCLRDTDTIAVWAVTNSALSSQILHDPDYAASLALAIIGHGQSTH